MSADQPTLNSTTLPADWPEPLVGMAIDQPDRSQTTDRMALHIRQTWLDGYQRAVEAMRDWADDFGDEQSKAAIRACADMVEAAKPTKEMLEGLNV